MFVPILHDVLITGTGSQHSALSIFSILLLLALSVSQLMKLRELKEEQLPHHSIPGKLLKT